MTRTFIVLAFTYTNHRGETRLRRVFPERGPNAIEFRSTPDHLEPQWIMHAYDLDKKARRSFAMRDMSLMRAVEVVLDDERDPAPPPGAYRKD